MLNSLITSKTRLKLLMKFFINTEVTGYLRNLATEFGESTNGIRQELNHMEEAKLLLSETIQNKKIYRANPQHPYYNELHGLVLKHIGIDQIVDNVVKRVGALQEAYIINDFALGNQGKTLDLVLVGEDFDQYYLEKIVEKAEKDLPFRIRLVTLSPEEVETMIPDKSKSLLIWNTQS